MKIRSKKCRNKYHPSKIRPPLLSMGRRKLRIRESPSSSRRDAAVLEENAQSCELLLSLLIFLSQLQIYFFFTYLTLPFILNMKNALKDEFF